MEQIYDSRHSGQEVDKAVDDVQTAIPAQLATIGSKIGDLTELETTDKSDLVSAINEVKNSAGGTYNLIENDHSSAMTIAQAILHIPSDKYAPGLHIVFNESGEGVAEYQYTWLTTGYITNASYWEKVPSVQAGESVVTSMEGQSSDLDIIDDGGFVLARFKDGHFQTKNFNSKDVIGNWLRGKTVAILGDSISTNGNTGADHNVPEITIASSDVGQSLSAYLTYYDVNASLSLGGHTFTSSEIGTEVTFTPVAGDVGKSIGLPANYNQNTVTTWWEVAASKLGFTPIPVCWSGSSITTHDLATSYNTGSNAHKMDCSYAWHESQIRKCGIRTAGTMSRVAPDAIIIYRGTNDFSHTSNVVLTDDFFSSGTLTYPQTDALENNLFGYKEGLVITINALREAYPFARIYLCTMNTFKRINYSNPPVNNGRNTLPQWNNAIREVADYMGCGIIEFDKDGITYENIYPTYASDSATTPTHPNDNGHLLMGERAIKDLLNN